MLRHRGMPCEDGRYWSQETPPKTASNPQNVERDGAGPHSRPQKEQACQHLDLDFWSPDLRDCQFLLVKSPSFGYFVKAALGN